LIIFPLSASQFVVVSLQTSWISSQLTISSEIVQGGAPSGKVGVSVESKEAGMVKESILNFKSSLMKICEDQLKIVKICEELVVKIVKI